MATTTDVEYNFLGKTGVKVSNICLGTMTFGKQEGGPFNFHDTPTHSDEKTAHSLLNRFVDLGGNFIDTANVYTGGSSETIIGNWLQSKHRNRNDVVLATKVRNSTKDKEPNNLGLSRRHITQALEGSLQRLQTEYIDLYQGHGWDNATSVEETLRTFDDLVRCGKIHYYGYSNLCGWQLQQVVNTYKTLGLQPCVTLQQQYSLLHRASEWEPFIVCQNEGIAVLSWSPLTGGLLTGKFKRGGVPDASTSRVGYMLAQKAFGQLGAWSQFSDDDQYWQIIDVLKQISNENDKTVAQVALKWVLQKGCVASVIIGATSLKQLEENMAVGSAQWKLSDEQMEALDTASANNKPYPYDMLLNARNAGRYNPFYEKSVKIPKSSI
ncbi:1-deoxyxylulose-5-phosphate synthase YajO-like [Ruditapes philippinarum]|uniref:1-deoxyxylulose-5-phosphate synthase YajO-like n=1 Tax=Ruditapes philippinarum TaxID=129788 RepID=UPI00295B9D60|nr:1-deoxyxylulose-5-phosphate synthase YajO-like [Ruditapes philippinarum]XP_060556223.1 1-deoxyxylulose-5-phosphate synthase YajO-like [Ruditapes philippinarum]